MHGVVEEPSRKLWERQLGVVVLLSLFTELLSELFSWIWDCPPNINMLGSTWLLTSSSCQIDLLHTQDPGKLVYFKNSHLAATNL